ncbi:hypothetical protein RSOLAG1IB_07473 [Rhizoctonia solani AG-1 IB]|uniref:Uncharacterized protein n=1 Tax=Thanatephorus cucumeris (strain AG1-IB / isolate 7/3/14) TaxID=1108050 RepID=A0A0B7FBQ1_THACB|nr:hypothetical protein RSOLAG1IB_07473 [Rhizoctonia solani AG-1 IB]
MSTTGKNHLNGTKPAQSSRNPVHYTDIQIVNMLGTTATAIPYGALHQEKTRVWNVAVAECNSSGLFPFDVTKKGIQDGVTSLMNSLE